MRRLGLFLSLFLIYIIPNVVYSKGSMYMAKAHLYPKPHKIYVGGLSADEKRCFEFALKQWIMYDKAPTATTTKDENNDNPNRTNKHVMAAGPCHNTGNAHIKVGTGKNRKTIYVGRSSRSFSKTEQQYMKDRYGDMSPFHRDGEPVKDPTTPGGRSEWFTSDPAKAHMKVVEKDRIPGYSDGCLGKADYDVIWVNAQKQFAWKSVQKPEDVDRTAELCVRKAPKPPKTYCYPSDTNGDGWITNADAPCPPNTIDYYQLLKHELGHFFSFLHEGKDFTEHTDGEPEHCCPGGVNELNSPYHEGGCEHGKDGEDEEHEGRMYFHSDRPGGHGGFDIWFSVWDSDFSQWGPPQNCGGAINTPYDEIDPHSTFGDVMLYFASNKPGGLGGFDLYYATHLDTATWDSVGTLQGLNSPANEFDPHEWSDQVFLFTSNRTGGWGNNDIWAATLLDTFNFLWAPPQNLGPNINTIANEEDPYLGELDATGNTGVLYFASNRPDTASAATSASSAATGYGGYDIHYALLTGGVWGGAVNIGPPVNTPDNEKEPVWDTRGNLLYYQSDIGIGMGGFDILVSPNVKPRPSVTWLYDGRGDPGDTVTVGYIVKNEGMIPLGIMPVVTTDKSWAYSADPSSFLLSPGEEMEYEIAVEIPDTNGLGEVMHIGLTAVAGPVSRSDTAQVWSGGPTSIDKPQAPFRYELRQNYPNPFNPTTTIAYALAEPTFVKLRVYDVSGRLVRTLVDREREEPGDKRALWNGRDNTASEVASGIYFYRLETKGFVQTRKMVLLR